MKNVENKPEEPQDQDIAIIACAMIASSIPVVPPAEWFANPALSGPTPLTVDDNGRVFGHIASWTTDHIGMSRGTRAPKSRSNYSYFHTGVVRADDGKDYHVGQLTLAGGHASLEASAVDAARHYDDTGSAIADVHAGEDKYGIWVAGALRPDATPQQIRALRASAPSGDWRPINGNLELVAVCQVNVPGFPIARARVASGQVYALVAAGTEELLKIKAESPEIDWSAKAAELSARINAIEHYESLGYISRNRRQKLAKEGKALPDGSYPISNESDLKNAIYAYGRSKPGKRAAVRRHIMKRARALKRADLIPEKWKSASVVDSEIDVSGIRARVASAEALVEFADISQDARERLAKEGKALPDGSYPIRNASDLENAIKAYGRSKPGDRVKVRRHIMKRARALGKFDIVPDKWKSASSLEEDANELRAKIASAKAYVSSGTVVPEERELADALITIAEKYGKFNEDDTGVWAGYESAAENEHKEYGVMCSNCVLYEGGTTCKIIAAEVEPGGYCRFAVIPDGIVSKDKKPQTLSAAAVVAMAKYIPGVNQPRDARGKFREVLGRIKQDLGTSGLQNVVEKIEETENLDNAGNYAQAAASAAELISIIDRLDTGALNATSLENVRESARLLGQVLSNLPLPFAEQTQKVRFSDLPPVLKNLIRDMVDRVEKKIGAEDAAEATKKLKNYQSGGDMYSQGEVSSEMSKLLRLLT